jgi:AcrR family transcriptional regulator
VTKAETVAAVESEAATPAAPPLRNRKTDQLMQGARKVFMERGFEGASVDEIARAAGASKATLYSYFPDKRQLFIAVVEAGCLRQGGMAFGRLDPDEPIEAALRRIAGEFGSFVLSPGALEMFRTCIAEAGRFPELGRAFYEAGPGRARGQLVALLDDAVARGELAIEDTGLAADQFAALAKARVFLATLLGQPIAPDDPELARVADEAVATFLARYAAKAPERPRAPASAAAGLSRRKPGTTGTAIA